VRVLFAGEENWFEHRHGRLDAGRIGHTRQWRRWAAGFAPMPRTLVHKARQRIAGARDIDYPWTNAIPAEPPAHSVRGAMALLRYFGPPS
jgi:hypothetical protein